MKILLSAYSINPTNGSEDGVGWNWLLKLSEKFTSPDDEIWVITKKFNEEDTRAGIEKAGLKNVRLVIVDVSPCLNWFREKYSVFHHMYYILWERVAYKWAKNSGIKFDIIHHATMCDFRIPGCMYKFKDAYTIFGPVGGGQSTPKSLKCYERSRLAEKFRETVNISRALSPSYRSKIKRFNAVYAVNGETRKIISKAMGQECQTLIEMALPSQLRNLKISDRKNEITKIIFVGRLIEKKGLMLLADVINQMDPNLPFELEIYGSGHLSDALEDFILKNALQNKVKLRGSVQYSKISDVYFQSDIFVMPSLRETSGNVLAEAMAHKLPVVALDMSICSELKKHNCGLFVNTNQSKAEIVKDFAEKLETLVKSAELRNRLGQNGYEYANSELSWDKKFETVYSGFLKNNDKAVDL